MAAIELVHHMKTQTYGRIGEVAVKLDISKVYGFFRKFAIGARSSDKFILLRVGLQMCNKFNQVQVDFQSLVLFYLIVILFLIFYFKIQL